RSKPPSGGRSSTRSARSSTPLPASVTCPSTGCASCGASPVGAPASLGWRRRPRSSSGYSRSIGSRLLHEKGLISDPVGRAKSVVLADEGLEKAERLFRQCYFGRGDNLSYYV